MRDLCSGYGQWFGFSLFMCCASSASSGLNLIIVVRLHVCVCGYFMLVGKIKKHY